MLKSKDSKAFLIIGAVSCFSVGVLATPGSGIVSTLFRATTDAFHADTEQTICNDATGQCEEWEIQLNTNGPSDIVTQNATLAPGGYSGWHHHPGPAILSVKSGTLSFYEGNDPTCTRHVYPAGTGIVEVGNDVHIARNESVTDKLELTVTYIVPRGASQRIDEPVPGNCPF
jgi:quercetin dioxygenase-like cupin family protein